MVATINTNAGALQALATLRNNDKLKDAVSKRIQTGYRVADSFDDASTFAVAQGIRSNIKQLSAVQQSLSAGEGLGQVSAAALKGISSMIADIKTKITQLSDGSLSSSQIATYGQDLRTQLSQVANYISQATYNGRNIFTTTSSVSYLADTNGTMLQLSSQSSNVSTAYNTFSASAISFTSSIVTSPGSAAYITSVSTAIAAFENSINTAMGTSAAEVRSFTMQRSFINDLVDAVKKGLGALVDADVSADSAELQATNVREQLIYQALSIANQAPQSLLTLFR